MKTILLTGATGYLGNRLGKKLLESGYRVLALGLSPKECFEQSAHSNAVVLFLNEISLPEIFERYKIDIVIHTATLYGRSQESNPQMIVANVVFPVEVLSLAVKYQAEVFINTSTILSSHLNAYALTKSQFVQWLELFAGEIKCVNLQLDHFYGPHDKPVKFVAWLIDQFKQNMPFINLTEGSQKRDFIYIDDVVSAYECVLASLDKIETGHVNRFEVGTNIKTSIKSLVLTLKDLMGNTRTKLNFGAVPYRKNEVLDYNVDTSALRLLGWMAKVTDIKVGLSKILKEEGVLK